MAFSISAFKSSVNDFLRPFAFEVFILPPGTTGASALSSLQTIRVRTENISLPGVAFLTAENYRQYGNGLTYTIPYGMNPQEINAIHSVDGEAEVIQMFYDWANQIVDMKGDSKFAPAYYNEYTRDMIINIYRLDGSRVRTYNLTGVYPISYDQIQLAWESQNEIVRLSVSYRYEFYTVT